MSNPKIVRNTVNVLTNPICFNLFQIIAKNPTSYMKLINSTNLNNHSLSKNLENLLKYSLVKIDFEQYDDVQFTAYKVTEIGKKFQNSLQDMISNFEEMPQNVPSKFILDAASFLRLYDKNNLDIIKKIFKDGTLVFTNADFIILTDHAEKINSDSLENFLYDDKNIFVAKSYQNPTNGVRTEFYLRRAKKLSQEKSQLIATALDLNAGIIASDEKMIKYAKQFGILSIDTERIFKLGNDKLIEKFYEFATTDDQGN